MEKGSSAASLVEQGLSLMRIENETQMKVAIQKPRQFKKIRKDVMEELETIPEFAMKSYYSIPYKNDMGGTTYV
ncbi:hypothetical protein GM524_13395, partial [Streptococcus pneumoniae]|nr:hypothetical protein [Streptococcus pneumoniae]